MKPTSFLIVALAGAMIQSTWADDNAPASSAADQQALKKIIESQGISAGNTKPASPGVIMSGYVSTSYTKQFGGSGPCAAAQSACSGVQTASKLAITIPPSDKNGWFGGAEIDIGHCSTTK